FGRLGSEEFGIFLHEVPVEEAETIAEIIRNKVLNLPIPFNDKTLKVTISLGVCHLPAHKKIDSALKKARQALDAAKNDGRNKTVVWGSVEHQSAIEETVSIQGYDHINDKVQTTSHALKSATL
ncbi:MAG: diguanylate cyclase, partial [Hyphomicrobiales bacterium]